MPISAIAQEFPWVTQKGEKFR